MSSCLLFVHAKNWTELDEIWSRDSWINIGYFLLSPCEWTCRAQLVRKISTTDKHTTTYTIHADDYIYFWNSNSYLFLYRSIRKRFARRKFSHSYDLKLMPRLHISESIRFCRCSTPPCNWFWAIYVITSGFFRVFIPDSSTFLFRFPSLILTAIVVCFWFNYLFYALIVIVWDDIFCCWDYWRFFSFSRVVKFLLRCESVLLGISFYLYCKLITLLDTTHLTNSLKTVSSSYWIIVSVC